MFPLGVHPPGFYIYSYEDRSEMAMLRKRNADLEAELAALKAKMNNNGNDDAIITSSRNAPLITCLRIIAVS